MHQGPVILMGDPAKADAAARTCSLSVQLAARAPEAVIYRRGPSKQTALILWDRSCDSFQVGQWFKGSLYPERSSLAPDGRHLLTFMGTHKPPFRTWTVLSRPPYFTALTLWPKGDTWGGGGQFLTDRDFILDHDGLQSARAPGFALPQGFAQHRPGPETNERIYRALADGVRIWRPRYFLYATKAADDARIEALLARDARMWRPSESSDGNPWRRTYSRTGAPGIGLRTEWHAADARDPWRGGRRFVLTWGARDAVLDGVHWADFDANDDLLFTIGGRLWRCSSADLRGADLRNATTFDAMIERARLLADFSDLTFRARPAPYAAGSMGADAPGGPAPDGFAPVLDRITKEDRRERQRMQRHLRREPRER